MCAQPFFTNIINPVRKKLGISVHAYMVADTIDKLSNNAKFQWCEWTREQIADFIGISRRTVINIVNDLIENGLIEINQNTKLLKSSTKWIDEVVLYEGEEIAQRGKKLHSKGEKISPVSSEKISPLYNDDNIDNNNINTIYPEKPKADYQVQEKKENEVIPDLLQDVKKHIQIIGYFAIAKKVVFTSKKHQSVFIKRHTRAAADLSAYDIERIKDVMRYLYLKADFKWELSTVLKYIDEDLNALNMRTSKGGAVVFN